MRKKGRKIRILGGVSIGLLTVILIAAFCPAVSRRARAAIANNIGWTYNLEVGDVTATPSSVEITMGAETENAKLNTMPGWGTDNAGAVVKRTVNVEIGATDGYTITVSGNPNLTSSAGTIPGVTTATTLGQMTNQWGWYSREGNAYCAETGVFRGMTSAGETIATGSLATKTTKTFTMCFGAKVDASQAGGTYTNTVMVSAVAEPIVTTTKFGGITTMQEMTQNLCSNATERDTAQLTDIRDGKKYWVTRLADGSCWMSQNLDLDLSKNKPLTTDTSATAWTPGQDTQTSVTVGSTSSTETYSWDLGEYVLNTPTATTACASNNTGLSACSAQGFVKVAKADGWTASKDPNFYRVTSYAGKNGATCSKSENSAVNVSASDDCKFYDAHYLVGNYYQWNAAVAGTGGSITNADATGSICPKGWRLPSSSDTSAGGFAYLLKRYAVDSTVVGTTSGYNIKYDIALNPLFFVRGGYIDTDSRRLGIAGQYGSYWSSRAYSSTVSAYYLNFGNSNVNPSDYYNRYYGRSLRCLIPTA